MGVTARLLDARELAAELVLPALRHPQAAEPIVSFSTDACLIARYDPTLGPSLMQKGSIRSRADPMG